MKQIITVLFLAVLSLSGCGESEMVKHTPIQITGTFTQSQADDIQAAIDAFKKNCKPLFNKYWGDVIDAKASVYPHIMNADKGREIKMPFAETYGWRQTLFLEITIAEDPEAIPNQIRAAGHTLFYHLGGGERPGMSIAKKQSSSVCDYENNGNNDLFVSVPAFEVVDRI